MSKFACEVVPVVLEPHPNADTLSIVKVWGYTVVVKTSDWEGADRGVYIPPDSVVPLHSPHFSWLTKPRITVKRFRGVYSQGLLIRWDGSTPLGTDLSEYLGITHWEPPVSFETRGEAVAGPPGLLVPKYDVENFNRYAHCLPEGTPVYITEKVHGCNARYVFYQPYVGDGSMMTLGRSEEAQMYCGSRSQWKADAKGDVWWEALRQNPWIEEWCQRHPNCVLYGEVFGQVQDLRYGASNGQLFFRSFDILVNGQWADYDHLRRFLIPKYRMPVLYEGPFVQEHARRLAEQDSVVCPGQLSEGVVICPVVETTHPEIGRVQLKIVSNRYLER